MNAAQARRQIAKEAARTAMTREAQQAQDRAAYLREKGWTPGTAAALRHAVDACQTMVAIHGWSKETAMDAAEIKYEVTRAKLAAALGWDPTERFDPTN